MMDFEGSGQNEKVRKEGVDFRNWRRNTIVSLLSITEFN